MAARRAARSSGPAGRGDGFSFGINLLHVAELCILSCLVVGVLYSRRRAPESPRETEEATAAIKDEELSDRAEIQRRLRLRK